MDKKQQLGQFYSKNKELIADFKNKVESEEVLVDPFAGQLDLLKLFPNRHEAYDIEPIEGVQYNDSYKTPIDYTGKFIITNPPYLNRNKTSDKTIFERYQTDDLYKAALIDIIKTGEKGIIIIPSGFWFNELNQKIRKSFLEKFRVENVNVFNKQMFDDTTYTVCSFYFEKQKNNSQDVLFNFISESGSYKSKLTYSKENDYSIQKDVEKTLLKYPTKLKIGRYTANTTARPTNIFLKCIDSSDRIQSLIKEPFMGISTDRAFLTFVVEGVSLTKEDEVSISSIFNQELERLRESYDSAFLSNYRNDGRKRISFTFAYKLLEHSIAVHFRKV